MSDESALVIFSGGQDSTTCLFWAMREFKSVYAISFDYGQRHYAELECAREICTTHGIEHHVLDLGLLKQLTSNSLTRSDIAVAPAHAPGELPNSFVEGRNLLFLTFAAIHGKTRGVRHLITGVSQSDFSGYPDCRDVFIKSLDMTLSLAMDYPFVIHTPLMWKSKAETWAMADRLGVLSLIKENTLTCYNGIRGSGCTTCPACLLRNRGLEEYERAL
jgi:7-cyano-7-deazaguanine synthase